MTSDLRLRIEPLQAAARAAGEVQLKVWNVRAGSLRRTGTTTAEKGLPGCGAAVATFHGRWKDSGTKDLYVEHIAAQRAAALALRAAGYVVLGSKTAEEATAVEDALRDGKRRARQPDDEFDLTATLTPADGLPATRTLRSCATRLRAIGVRVDDLCHVEDQLSVEFLVASRVSLARAADAEVDACSNGDGAGSALHNSGTDAPSTNAAEPSHTPTGVGCAGVNNDHGEAQPPPSTSDARDVRGSAWEEAVQRGTLDVAAVIDVVLQERSASRPATLADARNFLRRQGLACRLDNKAFKDAGAVLAVVTAHGEADRARCAAAVNVLDAADERNRHLASQLRALREADAGDKAERASRLAALMEAQAQMTAALQRAL